MTRIYAAAYLLLASAAAVTSTASGQQTPHLLRHPALSDTAIYFRYADDVWSVSRQGGAAHRLTSTSNVSEGPFVSPDGASIAYSVVSAGQVQAYTMPASGGAARRLTWQSTGNYVVGWTPDSRDVLVASPAKATRFYFQVYRIHADGSGLPERLPLPSASELSFSPDGSHVAYSPLLQWQEQAGSGIAAARRSPYGSQT